MSCWFYLASHAVLPLAIMAYAWLSRARASGQQLVAWPLSGRSGHPGGEPDPGVSDQRNVPAVDIAPLPADIRYAVAFVAAMVMLASQPHSVLDLWLLLVLWGWFLELALIVLASKLYTAGWYAARSLGLMSGLFVLFALLAETSKLYAQTVLQLTAQTQER